MADGRSIAGYAVAAATGIAAWEAVRRLAPRREAWDSELFWTAGYPAMLVVSAVLGFTLRRNGWRIAAAMLTAQAIWSLAVGLASGSSMSMFPMGLIVFGFLFVPCALVAMGAQKLGRMILGEATDA